MSGKRCFKYFILIIALSYGCASAKWTKEDTYRQAGFVAVTGVDWLQTREIAKSPGKYRETNPILGEHPSLEKVDAYFAVCVAAHTSIAVALPPEYRKWWQYVWIGLESYTVGHNFATGLRFGL